MSQSVRLNSRARDNLFTQSHIHTKLCVHCIYLNPPKSAYFCLKWHISLQKFAYVKKKLYLCSRKAANASATPTDGVKSATKT